MRRNRRLTALLLALILVILTGCAAPGPEIASAAPEKETAMGRYVEQDFPLPEDGVALDMVTLSDGRLRAAVKCADGSARIFTTGPDRTAWEDDFSLPRGTETELVSEYGFALSPTGEVFYSTTSKRKDDGSYEHHLYLRSGTGEIRELPINYPNVPDVPPEISLLIWDCDFTGDGRLFTAYEMEEVCQLNLEDGSLGQNVNELESSVSSIACVGQSLYMINRQRLTASVCRDGKTEALDGALMEKITQSLQATEGYDSKLTFWENGEGYLFFTTDDGLYSYIPGGSVLERLVEGGRSTLGDPSFFPKAMTGAEDGSFYVLGNSMGTGAVYRYVYDPDVPTVPDVTMRIYSLYDDDILRQMISGYQKSHPEVALTLEVGISGDDAVTVADAIRTLNTEILAGSGPDILRLDGLSLDTYLEKGLLADLSGVLSQAGPLLEQVTNSYAQDGKVCALPTGFVLPVIYGPGHIVSQIHDLDSLVAAASQAREEKPDARSVMAGFLADSLADQFYDSCSAAWIRPDGTLDEEKLTAYYDAMQRLFAMDADVRQEIGQARLTAMAEGYVPGEYTGSSGALMILTGTQLLCPGTLCSMNDWASLLAGDDQLDGYELVPISLQAGHVFLPQRVMGILSTSSCQEAAAEFLVYMLSDGVQTTNGWSNTFPVNKTVFDREIQEDRETDMSFGLSGDDGEMLSVSAKWPDARRRQELKTWVDALDTPALTNQTIRTMVIAQMDDCLNGRITPRQAAQNALKNLNLYLSE